MKDEVQQDETLDAPAGDKAGSSLRLLRPETGVALLLVFAISVFVVLAGDKGLFTGKGIVRWMVASAEFALVAVPACLLIAARQFDLSAGAMIGISGMIIAWMSALLGYPVWMAILTAIAAAAAIGLINGMLTAFSGVPSVVVTLGSMFALRGLTALIATSASGSVVITGVRDVAKDDPIAAAFGGEMFRPLFDWLAGEGWISVYEVGHRAGDPIITGVPMIVIWAIIVAIVAYLISRRFTAGNEEQASETQAREMSPTFVRLRWNLSSAPLGLFVFSAICAAVFAACQVTDLGSAATDRGQFKAFEGIAAAIIGGAAVAGGTGTVIGAVLAALLFGLVREGVLYAGGEAALFYVIIGVLLLPALLVNRLLRRAVMDQ